MKTNIDIEDLLVWAYRDMEADKVRAETFTEGQGLASSWGAVDRAVNLGAVVRGSGHELLPGDCDDAAMIDAAVMELDSSFVASGDAGETIVLDRSTVEAGGGRVDVMPGDRAMIVHADGRQIAARNITVSVHLILAARSATRPDCFADIARRRGRPSKDGEIAPGLTFEDLMHARAVYSVWHAALGVLALDLADKLNRWVPTGPKSDESPWLRRSGRLLEAVSAINSTADKPLKKRRKPGI